MPENIDLTFRANLKNLTDQLASLPDVTAKEAKAMVKALERETKKAERAMARNAKEVDREWKGRMGDIKRAGATAFGDSINKVDDLASGLAAMGGPAGIAVAAVAGITIAIGATVAASIALTRQMDELIAANEHLAGQEGFSFPPELQGQVEQANASLDLLGAIVRQVAIGIGEQVVPVVGDASRVLVKLGLMGLDAFNGMGEAGAGVGDIIDGVTRMVFLPWLQILLSAVDGAVLLAKVAGFDLPDGITGMTDAIREATSITAWLGVGLEKLDVATSDYDARVDALIGTQVSFNAAQRDGAHATGQSARAMEEARLAAELLAQAQADQQSNAEAWMQAQQAQAAATQQLWQVTEDYRRSQLDERVRLEEDTAARIAEVQALANQAGLEGQALAQEAEVALRQQLADQLLSIEQERLAAEVQAAQEAQQAKRQQLVDLVDATSSTVSSVGTLWRAGSEAYLATLEEGTAHHKKAAKIHFAIQKGVSIVEAGIQGALAAVKAIALFGPPPSPAGIAALAAAAATTTASIVAIATQPPPAFHVGGMIGASTGPAPDEVDIRARNGEGVLTRQGVRALGAMNRGHVGGGGIVVVQTYQHQVFDAQVQDSLRDPSSALRQAALEGRRRTGHSSRVRG